jgi:hypothetical protein
VDEIEVWQAACRESPRAQAPRARLAAAFVRAGRTWEAWDELAVLESQGEEPVRVEARKRLGELAARDPPGLLGHVITKPYGPARASVATIIRTGELAVAVRLACHPWTHSATKAARAELEPHERRAWREVGSRSPPEHLAPVPRRQIRSRDEGVSECGPRLSSLRTGKTQRGRVWPFLVFASARPSILFVPWLARLVELGEPRASREARPLFRELTGSDESPPDVTVLAQRWPSTSR